MNLQCSHPVLSRSNATEGEKIKIFLNRPNIFTQCISLKLTVWPPLQKLLQLQQSHTIVNLCNAVKCRAKWFYFMRTANITRDTAIIAIIATIDVLQLFFVRLMLISINFFLLTMKRYLALYPYTCKNYIFYTRNVMLDVKLIEHSLCDDCKQTSK